MECYKFSDSVHGPAQLVLSWPTYSTSARGAILSSRPTTFSVSHSQLVQTDWGQSVFKVGRRCIATLQLWVGIQPISSSHTPYPVYMCGPLCLPLATLCPSSPQDTCGLS